MRLVRAGAMTAFVLALGLGCETGATTSTSSSSGIPASRWIDDASAPLPTRLSEVGVFASMATRAPAAGVVAYAPRFPLFSDGLAKERLVHMPAGVSIDASGAQWTFPVGVVFAKTFLDGDEPIETRLLYRRAEGWAYAVYVWRADGSDADRLDGPNGNWSSVGVLTPGGVAHDVPSRLDCRSCHETSEELAGHPVLGVNRWQVDDAFAASGVFAAPPALTPIEGRTPAETTALGFFVGNCVSCHTGGKATNASFSLAPADAIANTVNVPTESETGEGIRLVPGDPDASVLFVAVVLARKAGYDGPFKAMPPIGTNVSDPSIEAPLRAWIEGL